MCGIAGELRFDGQLADVHAVFDITRAQARRGPNGQGFYSLGGRCFGHRRLSIMDLSERAHQPFVDNMLGLGVVFNGAIYNHHELREELPGLSVLFDRRHRSHPQGLACLGPDRRSTLLRHVRLRAVGARQRVTFLARDRLGIKPLYYTPQRRLCFRVGPACAAHGRRRRHVARSGRRCITTCPSTRWSRRRTRSCGASANCRPATLLTVHPKARCEPATWWSLGLRPQRRGRGTDLRRVARRALDGLARGR